MKIISNSVKDTLALGLKLAKYLIPGDIICLEGELGAGKTTLTKGIAAGLGVSKSKVTSSSFILIRQHLEGRLPLFHFDLYRLKKPQDLAALGYEEYFYGLGASVIEWANRLECLMPEERLMVELTYGQGTRRIIKITGEGLRYKELLKKIK